MADTATLELFGKTDPNPKNFRKNARVEVRFDQDYPATYFALIKKIHGRLIALKLEITGSDKPLIGPGDIATLLIKENNLEYARPLKVRLTANFPLIIFTLSTRWTVAPAKLDQPKPELLPAPQKAALPPSSLETIYPQDDDSAEQANTAPEPISSATIRETAETVFGTGIDGETHRELTLPISYRVLKAGYSEMNTHIRDLKESAGRLSDGMDQSAGNQQSLEFMIKDLSDKVDKIIGLLTVSTPGGGGIFSEGECVAIERNGILFRARDDISPGSTLLMELRALDKRPASRETACLELVGDVEFVDKTRLRDGNYGYLVQVKFFRENDFLNANFELFSGKTGK